MKKNILKQRFEIRGNTIRTLTEIISEQERELAAKDRELNEAAEIITELLEAKNR
jgi:hypothetical protein